ncbi:unnamed protein product [Camellia sinensis]
MLRCFCLCNTRLFSSSPPPPAAPRLLHPRHRRRRLRRHPLLPRVARTRRRCPWLRQLQFLLRPISQTSSPRALVSAPDLHRRRGPNRRPVYPETEHPLAFCVRLSSLSSFFCTSIEDPVCFFWSNVYKWILFLLLLRLRVPPAVRSPRTGP